MKRSKDKGNIDLDKLVKQKLRDPEFMLKLTDMADDIEAAKCAVVYTGAGISTNANIPDYRGKNGVYTAKRKGEKHPGCPDLREVNPTVCHCLLREMLRDGYISHIVSQNCDALHLRSGIPQNLISEIHGNSFIEWCKTCHKQFIRDFDVTHDSDRETHVTKRKCEHCDNPLVDTIIYCNESRWLPFPQNWIKIEEIKKNIDLIIVLGTSCKVLAGYKMLFPAGAKIYVINQGRTEIDELANVKFNEDCDIVMQALSTTLRLSQPPNYCRTCDPILNPAMKVAVNEWPKCICGRRPIRKLAKHLYSTSASTLETNLFPSWMVVPLSKKRSIPKQKMSPPQSMAVKDEEEEEKPPIRNASTGNGSTSMSSSVLERVELIPRHSNLPEPAITE